MATKSELEEMLLKMQFDQMENYKIHKKVKIQNLSALEVSFYPETLTERDTLKGILLDSYVISEKFDYNEIKAQIRANNFLFVGKDGLGQHATIRICDFEMYKDLFELPDATKHPVQLTEDAIEMLISENDKQTFKEKLSEYVATKNEAATLVDYLENKKHMMDKLPGWKKNMVLEYYKKVFWR